ncbi:MAG: indole-3-glycerol phosphate synthase TrpC [Deltaproteobacteria bacterium]|nr:MAG: indole-3-glycerol phosphate synthase TrpC [Deltaproteobacteria bacterium]
MFLDEIVEHKRKELKEVKRKIPLTELEKKLTDLPPTKGFKKVFKSSTLDNEPITRIIAEIKKASPSKGIIRDDFDPVKIARVYEKEGAVAISVLTESNYFKGCNEHLRLIRDAVEIPLLRKDFIFDEYQVYEARVCGADAVLLISAILEINELKNLIRLSRDLGLDCLLEVHNQEELKKVLATEGEIIGINNRDLHSFKVDVNTTLKLIPQTPRGITIISESGISNREEIVKLQKAGVDGFLIGEALIREQDIGSKLKELLGKS